MLRFMLDSRTQIETVGECIAFTHGPVVVCLMDGEQNVIKTYDSIQDAIVGTLDSIGEMCELRWVDKPEPDDDWLIPFNGPTMIGNQRNPASVRRWD